MWRVWQIDFPKMLASVLQALQGSSKSAQVDAYLAINGALAMYDGLPDLDDIRRNMTIIETLLLRDIALKHPANVVDNNIIVQAVKLAARFTADENIISLIRFWRITQSVRRSR